MGLDMWLYTEGDGGNEQLAYWRKANQIRAFFASYVPEKVGENIDRLTVTLDMLNTLEEKVDKCLKARDMQVSKQLLPTSSGFFFGCTDYDNYYYDELERTKDIIQAARREITNGHSVIYTEWW